MANPWDVGSARILEQLGFAALATTSAGFAGTRGHEDGTVSRDEALAHAAEISAAVRVPVSADLENGFADDPDGVAQTVRLATTTGLAGCSIEDWDPRRKESYAVGLATERVAAAAEAAHAGPTRLVLTARADAAFHGEADLDDVIVRLRAFEAAGADVLYAPAISRIDEIARILDAITLPLNVIALPDAPSVEVLAAHGVARISVGSGFYWAAVGGLVAAAREVLDEGSYRFWQTASTGRQEGRRSFS